LNPRRSLRTLALVAAGLLGSLLPAPGAPVEAVRVDNQGPGPMDQEFIRSHIHTEEGREFERSALVQDIRNLERTGRFANVTARVDPGTGDGVVVTYTVTLRPRLTRLRIEGAREVRASRVRGLLELQLGEYVDQGILARKLAPVAAHYRKNFLPDATFTWTVDADPVTGEADVTLTIVEGAEVRLRSLSFEGNQAVSDADLRAAVESRPTHLFTFLTGRGKFDRDLLDRDATALQEVYRERGYLDARITGPDLVPARRSGYQAIYRIQEGPLYRLDELSVEGVTLFPRSEIHAAMGARPGDPAGTAAIRDITGRLHDYYGSRGYLRTEVVPDVRPDHASHTVDLVFRIAEGRLAYIRDVIIRGNEVTQDKVVRRELVVLPGQLYDEVAVRRSEQRLRNTGNFAMVRGRPLPTPEADRFDLLLDVTEQKTGQFMVGTGFSSVDNLIGFAEVSQGNFDLFNWPPVGAGQKMRVRATFGTERRDLLVSFTEPWFLDRQLALGVDLFQNDRRFLSDDYDQRNTGGSVSLSRPIWGGLRGRMEYGLQEIEVRNVDITASDLIKAEEGSQLKSALTFSVLSDTRDSVFFPTRGQRGVVSATYAGGPLGGDTDNYELRVRHAVYIPLWFRHVFMVRGEVVTVEPLGDAKEVPIFDRVFLGGSGTIRGFDFRDVGPKDNQGEPIGGRTGAYVSTEYTIPVGGPFRLAGFYDTGMVWTDAYTMDLDNLNSGYGVGLRVDIPQFPIRIDYAWQAESDEFNESSSGKVHFVIGYTF
jgi:outer membrane protein insertion porin family